MKKSLVSALFLGAVSASAQAQTLSANCASASAITQDACQKTIDLFETMAPQFGTSMSAGAGVLGQTEALGALGRFAIGVRVNGMRGALPQFADVAPSVTGAVSSTYGSQEQVMGFATVDGAFGIFQGFATPAVRLLALDALANASYIPSLELGSVSLSTVAKSVRFGYGARLGVIQEGRATPALSLVYLRRGTPGINLSVRPGDDELTASDIGFDVSSIRATLGKSFGPIGLLVGAGSDQMDGTATVSARVTHLGATVEAAPFTVAQDRKETSLFGEASLRMGPLHLVGGVGRTSGSAIATYNTYDAASNGTSRNFATLSLVIVR